MICANKNARVQPGVGKAKDYGSQDTVRHGIKQGAERAIVMLARWGLLPVRLADWLIRREGLQ